MPQQVAAPQMSIGQINAMQRQRVLSTAVDMVQSLSSQVVSPASQPLLNIPVRNVGLVKRFTVIITGVIANTGTVSVNLTDTGLANVLSQVQFQDLNNNTRINTTGLHLSLLADEKARAPYGGAFDVNQTNGGNRSQMLNVPPASWGIFQAPATIANGATGNFRAVFEIPLAYTDDDLRGAVWANVVNATMQLSLTLTQSPVSANPGDNTFAVYSGAAGAAGNIQSASVTVYQHYLDQLPTNPKTGQVILPVQDISTIYEIKNTNFTAISSGQDFNIPFANFRDFYSLNIIYNNTGGYAGRSLGTDINYLAVRTANLTDIKKVEPLFAAQMARNELGFDLPAGHYYFSFRRRPISTTQFGNVNLVLNPSTASGGAQIQAMWESFGLMNTLANASALPSS